MGLSVKTSAAITNSPPTPFTIRAQAMLDCASFIGSARQKRRMPLRASTSSARDRKSTRLNSSHEWISYAVFCLKKKIEVCDRSRRELHRARVAVVRLNQKFV